VTVDGSTNGCEQSSNFLTWRFTNDWYFTNGKSEEVVGRSLSCLRGPHEIGTVR
jgi:hypothetical protein